jgi:hypothetical protein
MADDTDSTNDERGYDGLARVTKNVGVTYTVMNKQRADLPSTESKEGKSQFQRKFIVMSPARGKKAPPKGISSIYI